MASATAISAPDRADDRCSPGSTGTARGPRGSIHVRPRFVPNEFSSIRVTPNVFTTLGEVDAFSEAIEAAIRELV